MTSRPGAYMVSSSWTGRFERSGRTGPLRPVIDDQGRLRKHVVIFVDGQAIQDRAQLGDAVEDESELLVMQALSGG